MSSRKESKLLTKERRKTMSCQVFQVKVDRSKLSNATLKHLNSVFNEAKWMYNYILSQPNISMASTTIKTVPVKTPDGIEYRDFKYLSAQMKQSIKERIFNSLAGLSSLKKKGKRVGRLKFKSFINSIPLKQPSVTYTITDDKKHIKLQGLKHKLRVNGLEQIPEDSEIANAMLVRKCSDFYFHITTYTHRQKHVPPKESIGIDFGCATQLTFSNGIKIEFQVPISDKLKRLDRRIDKKVNGKTGKNRGSKNRRKLQARRRKEYEHIANKKKDIRHKIVSAITNNYKYVCFQDESIHTWHAGNHGKKIQNSGIGGIISDLKNKSETPVMINKFFHSTQLCPKCGCLNKLKISERTYKCGCGFVEDRDIKSAKCIEMEGIRVGKKDKIIPMEHRNFKPEENLSSAFFDVLMKVNGVKVGKMSSMSQEALLE
jgi:putative transposase